jgi:hypothetical protein
VVIVHVSNGDQQSDPPEGDGMLARDHSKEWMWAALELVTSRPQPLEGIKVQEVEATAPVDEGFGESGCPDQWVDYEGKPPQLGGTIQVVCLIKSDRGLGPVKVFWGGRAYGVDCPAGKLT